MTLFGCEVRVGMATAMVFTMAAGCARERREGTPEVVATSRAALNANPALPDFAILVNNSVLLRKNAMVSGGDVGARATGPGTYLLAGRQLGLQRFAQVDFARTAIGYSISLVENSETGDLNANEVSNNGGTIHGTIGGFPVAMPSLPPLSAVQPGTANLVLGQFTTQEVGPGSWAQVDLGKNAVLRLQSGLYQFGEVQLGDGARLEALGAIEVRIAGRLDATNDSYIGFALGTALTAKDVRVEVGGINGTSGGLGADPKAANLGNHSETHALLLVPNGTIQLRSTTQVFGALLARDVDVGEFSHVTFQDGFGTSGCASGCDDSNACTSDACVADVCTHTVVPAGSACGDGNSCNGAETCNTSGQCEQGIAPAIDDGNPCTVDSCDPTTGVQHLAAADGSPCSDGNACTETDSCSSGRASGRVQ